MAMADTTEPIPPMAKIAPSASGPSSSWFFTRNGRSTWTGPMKQSRLNIADTSVAHSHGVRRAKARPSPTSAMACRTPWDTICRAGGRVMPAMATAETRKLAASTRKAVPALETATTKPPIAGPMRRMVSGRIRPLSALACARSSSGNKSGTIAVMAGLKKASPSPTNAIRTMTCHSSMTPVSDRMPSSPIAAARTRSAPIMRRRRSYRSVKTPPRRRKAMSGSVQATPTTDRAVGTLLIS